MVLWWLLLGVPLSWAKGAIYFGLGLHTWIGVVFSTPSEGVARMALPAPFVADIIQQEPGGGQWIQQSGQWRQQAGQWCQKAGPHTTLSACCLAVADAC